MNCTYNLCLDAPLSSESQELSLSRAMLGADLSVITEPFHYGAITPRLYYPYPHMSLCND